MWACALECRLPEARSIGLLGAGVLEVVSTDLGAGRERGALVASEVFPALALFGLAVVCLFVC